METLLFVAALGAIVLLVLGYARTEAASEAGQKPWLFSYKTDKHEQKSHPGKAGT